MMLELSHDAFISFCYQKAQKDPLKIDMFGQMRDKELVDRDL